MVESKVIITDSFPVYLGQCPLSATAAAAGGFKANNFYFLNEFYRLNRHDLSRLSKYTSTMTIEYRTKHVTYMYLDKEMHVEKVTTF